MQKEGEKIVLEGEEMDTHTHTDSSQALHTKTAIVSKEKAVAVTLTNGCQPT